MVILIKRRETSFNNFYFFTYPWWKKLKSEMNLDLKRRI